MSWNEHADPVLANNVPSSGERLVHWMDRQNMTCNGSPVSHTVVLDEQPGIVSMAIADGKNQHRAPVVFRHVDDVCDAASPSLKVQDSSTSVVVTGFGP